MAVVIIRFSIRIHISSHHCNRSVKTSKVTYAAMLRLVRTTTTLPLVRNLLIDQHRPITQDRLKDLPFPTQPVLAHLAEKLSIPLHTPESTNSQHTSAIDGKQRPDAVELGGENLQHD